MCASGAGNLIKQMTRLRRRRRSQVVMFQLQFHFPNLLIKQFSNLVAVGSQVYSIARFIIYYDTPSSKVSVLDCRSPTWRKAPRMKVEPLSLTTGVINRKIYVAGLQDDEHYDPLQNSFEVFDTVTQIWDPEPFPFSESNGKFYTPRPSACVDGKFHVVTENDVVAYDSTECRWDMVGRVMKDYTFRSSYCSIADVLYSVTDGTFRWYDTELRVWRRLLGLVGLPKFPPLATIILVDYGGNMVVFWDDFEPYYKPGEDYLKLICCVEITLERPNSNEILGES